MSDKPGCVTLEELAAIKAVAAKTGRIWSIDFSERFEVPAVTKAAELVAQGAIGKVIQTVGLGPHRLNKAIRPEWFFRPRGLWRDHHGYCQHQSTSSCSSPARRMPRSLGRRSRTTPTRTTPGLQDFGEVVLRGDPQGTAISGSTGTRRMPCPTWGDGRLTILGHRRLYRTAQICRCRRRAGNGPSDPGQRHRLREDRSRSGAGLPYFARLIADIRDRTETAMTQAHVFKVCELALRHKRWQRAAA